MRRRELASYAAVVVGVALLAIVAACLIGMAGCGKGTGTPAPAVTTSRTRTTSPPKRSTTRPRTGVPLRQPAPRSSR